MTVKLLRGDCRELLRTLADGSVHCCVTSPPYWGLRSYLPDDHPDKHREIGSEPTLQLWVQTIVEVMREVRRVLRPDGTVWLNLGDAYAGSRQGPQGEDSTLAGNGHQGGGPKRFAVPRPMTASARRDDHRVPRSDVRVGGLKPKELMGQPWRAAFALQDDGWWLRQEIIWHKPNPMPESVRDRCTKAHEHVFLLSKSEKYFYDFDAMQEPVSGTANARGPRTPAGWDTGPGNHDGKAGRYPGNGVGFGHGFDKVAKPRAVGVGAKAAAASAQGAHSDGAGERMGRGAGWRVKQNESFSAAVVGLVDTRNPRSVWTIPTHAFRGAHFATFPPALAERCITAGCPEMVCPHCGTPWTIDSERVDPGHDGSKYGQQRVDASGGALSGGTARSTLGSSGGKLVGRRVVKGRRQTCACGPHEPVGGTVVDPFGGSGTVGLVADRQHKNAILIDLDERNVPMARERIAGDSPLFARVEAA